MTPQAYIDNVRDRLLIAFGTEIMAEAMIEIIANEVFAASIDGDLRRAWIDVAVEKNGS